MLSACSSDFGEEARTSSRATLGGPSRAPSGAACFGVGASFGLHAFLFEAEGVAERGRQAGEEGDGLDWKSPGSAWQFSAHAAFRVHSQGRRC